MANTVGIDFARFLNQHVLDLDQCGIEVDVKQLTALVLKGCENGYYKVAKSPPDPKKVERNTEIRLALGDFLIATTPPSYNGQRETGLTKAEILTNAKIPIDASSLGILRNLLENPTSRFHEWGAVDVVMGQTLYARSARLIQFRAAA